jgi:class 3 adenylate cyclase
MKADRRFNPNQILDAHEWRKSIAIALIFSSALIAINCIDWIPLLTTEKINIASIHFMNPSSDKLEIILMTCLLGAAIATVLHPLMFWFSLALMFGALVIVSMSYSSYDGFNLWWSFPVIGMLGSGSTVFGLKEWKLRQVIFKVKVGLEDMVPGWILQKIMSDPRSLNITDRQVSGTLVVIDIVGLATLGENYHLKETMSAVRSLSHNIRAIVHRFGGVMMPSYREGFLCIFGDMFHNGSSLTWHAEYALQCAMEIQKLNAKTMLAAAREKQPVLAIRIGINSSRIVIGNLGRQQGVDFTIFGTALEEARTYERSCETSSILFSRSTRDMLVKIDRNSPMFAKRIVNATFGQNADKVEAYELDPFHDAPEIRRDITKVWREALKLTRAEERWPIKNLAAFRLATNIGQGNLINISMSGMALLLDQATASGTSLRIKIDTENQALKGRLENRDLTGFNVLVKWSKPSGNVYLHGVEYKDMARSDKEFLLQCLLESQESVKTKSA